MKKLSTYLFLIFFSFSAPSFADDISEYQIEGISIGDSLLDYMSEEEIKENVGFVYEDKKFTISEYNKSFDRTVKLPLKIWPSYTQKFIAVGGPRQDTCVLEGEPTTMTPMTDVEILEEASCLYTLLLEEGMRPGHYFIGIKKVRIIDTGEIGWTWNSAITE